MSKFASLYCVSFYIVIFNTFIFNLCIRTIINLPTTITIIEYYEFSFMFAFAIDFNAFRYFFMFLMSTLSIWRTPFGISCKAGLVVKNSFNFCVSENLSLSILKDSYQIDCCFYLPALNVTLLPLVCRFLLKNPLTVTWFPCTWKVALWVFSDSSYLLLMGPPRSGIVSFPGLGEFQPLFL